MKKLPIKILTISWDPTLAMNDPKFGDVQARNVKYGEKVRAIYSITYSKKSAGLTDKQWSREFFVYPTGSVNQLIFLLDAWKLAKKICQKHKIDLVLTQDPFLTGLVGTWVKQKFGCKLLVHYHGDFWHNKNWLKEKWYNRVFNILQRIVLRRADALRVMSQGQKEKFLQTGWAEKRVRVISTPVDLKKYHKNTENTKTQKTKIVLHVGRDDKVKDYDTLAKAFGIIKKKMPSAEMWQVGVANSRLLADSGVKLKGQVSHGDLVDIYHQSDVVVLSSTSESFGKVLVEANACGKPVVATATTGAKEIVQDGVNGYLTPIGDAHALADKVLALLNNPKKAKQMGEAGKKMMRKKYSDNTDKIVQFWNDIINEKI